MNNHSIWKGILIILFFLTIFSPLSTLALSSAFSTSSSGSTSYISFSHMIKTLQDRKDVQIVLNEVMTPSPNLVVDGVLGRKSIQAVQAFQEVNGLTADGKVGPITRLTLEKAQGYTSSSTTSTTTVNASSECAPPALFSNITGKLCGTLTSTLPTGCTSSTLFSPLTGQSCSKITLTTQVVIPTTPNIPPVVRSGGGGGGGGGGGNPATCSGSTSQSCTITNGQGSQSRTCNSGTWSDYGTCTLVSCNTGYQTSGNICVATTVVVHNVATTFYVSSSGNDSYDGLTQSTPWQSITKVNAQTFLPGDNILFKKGDTFYGGITISQSGTAGNPITFSSYGTGNQPIITGFTTVAGWTNEGGGIYSKVISSQSQTNMVTVDGINIAMGRYPNADQVNGGYLTYESFNSNVSITDNQLTGTPNWVGAEVVIRKNDWTLDRSTITSQTGGTLAYTSLGTTLNATANYGYFIQNDLRTLDQFGEWYHNTSSGKFYMYFGGVDPNTKVVKVATQNKLFYSNGYDYITIENITFTGSIDTGINYHWGANYGVVKNSNVTFAGGDGIRYSGSYGLIDNNFVSDCVRTGVGTFFDGRNTVITNNTITNIGLIKGQGKTISGVWSPNSGIAVEYDNNLIQYNRIENIGYNGIQIAGGADFLEVKNNFVNNTCLTLDDCGGLYIDAPHSSVIIENNIFLNAFGNTDGAADSSTLAEGIYLDELASNVIVRNNTAAGNSNSGIKLHKANNNIIEDNTLFNNYSGINFESHIASSTIYGNVINRNIFFAKASIQLALRFISATNDIPSFGTADNNYYARPIDDNLTMLYYQPNISYSVKTFAQWQTFTSQDSNSYKSPVSITDSNDILFDYNATTQDKTVPLGSSTYLDVTSATYSGSVTLSPYTSIILIKQGIVQGASTYDFALNLKYGSTGNEVKELQKILISSSYLTGIPDGLYRTLTLNAVKEYQKANGLTPDGIIGSLTREVLNK